VSAEYKSKIRITSDVRGATEAAKSINGLASASLATSMVMQGNLVGAMVSARAAAIALRSALVANPYLAVGAAVLALGAKLASVAWKKHTAEVEAHKKALDDLRKAQESYAKTVADIKFSRADAFEKVDIRRAELKAAQAEQSAIARRTPTTQAERDQKAVDAVKAAERVAIAQQKLSEATDATAQLISDANDARRSAERDALATAQQLRRQEAEERERLIQSIRDQRAKIAEDIRTYGMSDEERLDDLKSQRDRLVSEGDDQFNLQTPAQREQRQLDVDKLTFQISALEKTLQDRKDREHDNATDIETEKRKQAYKAEEDYAFSKLSKAEQLKQTNTEIEQIDKKEKDSGFLSGEDRLRRVKLKERRDRLEESGRLPSLPQEGFDSFLRDRGRMPGGPQLADSKSARRFRSRLGPSFADRLTASSFGKSGKEGGDTRTAEQKLLSLQERSVEYQKIMAEKIQDIALKE